MQSCPGVVILIVHISLLFKKTLDVHGITRSAGVEEAHLLKRLHCRYAPSSFLLLVATPFAPSSFLLLLSDMFLQKGCKRKALRCLIQERLLLNLFGLGFPQVTQQHGQRTLLATPATMDVPVGTYGGLLHN